MSRHRVWNCAHTVATLAVLALSAAAARVEAAAFMPLGFLPGTGSASQGWDVSADGSVVVGRSGTPTGSQRPFIWTQATGIQPVALGAGHSYGYANGVSGDGSAVVGTNHASDFTNHAFRWTAGGGTVLLGGGDYSEAYATSHDGSVVVGTTEDGYAARRTSGGGWQSLASGSQFGAAYGVSSDGTVVAGDYVSAPGQLQAFRWTEGGGRVGLGDLAGGTFWSDGFNVSPDGGTVVGFSKSTGGDQAFRWTQGGGMVGLGWVPGTNASYAYDASMNGSLIVGESFQTGGTNRNAFLWDAMNGTRSLKSVLEGDYGLDLTGWTLYSAQGISADGSTIVGMGRNPVGQTEAWVARIPEPATSALLMLGGAAVLRRRAVR